MSDLIVTLAHLSSVPGYSVRSGFCRKGGRRFFKRYGLDWSAFIHHGINASVLISTDDALALALVEHARNEVANGR